MRGPEAQDPSEERSPKPIPPGGAALPGKGVALLLLGVHLLGSLLFLLSRASGTDSAWAGLPLDDSWIHLVYARSLAEHLAFMYNPGAWEAGMTSPLWCLLAAPFVRVALWTGLPTPLAVKLLGILVAAAASLVIFAAIHRWTSNRTAAWSAAILPALEPNLGFARLSGMEVWLAALVLILSLALAAEDRWGWAGLVVGLGLWVRPENALWAVVLPAALLGAPRIGPLRVRSASASAATSPDGLTFAGATRRLLRFAAPVAAAALLYIAFAELVTGRPLFNTYYAKYASSHGLSLGAWLRGMWVQYLRASGFFRWGGGVALLVLGIFVLARGKGAGRRWAAVLLALYPVLYALVQTGNKLFLRPSAAFAYNRYYEPCLLLLLVPAGVGLGSVLDGLRTRLFDARRAHSGSGARPQSRKKGTPEAGRPVSRRSRAGVAGGGLSPAILVLGAAAALLTLAPWPPRLASRVRLYSWNTRNIEDHQVAIGKYLRQNASPGSAVALNDAGAIRYFSGLPALDLTGLNTHELAGLRKFLPGTWRLMEARHVDWVAVLAAWYPQFEGLPGFERRREFQAENFSLEAHYAWSRSVVYYVDGGVRMAMAAPLYTRQGDQLLQRGAWELAEDQYRYALECAPGDTALIRRLQETGARRDEARTRLRTLRSTGGASLSAAELGEMSDLAFRLGEDGVSREAYRSAVLLAPDVAARVRLASQRAQNLARHEQGPAALDVLRAALDRDAKNPVLLLQLGALATSGDMFREAERALRAALEAQADPGLKYQTAAAMIQLADRSGNPALGREAVLALYNLPVDPEARAQLEARARGIVAARSDWD